MAKGGKRDISETATVACWNCGELVKVSSDALLTKTQPPCNCGQEISSIALLKSMGSFKDESPDVPRPKIRQPGMSTVEVAKAGLLSKRIQADIDAERPYRERVAPLHATMVILEKLMKKRHKA
ncbi:hypothetical protein WME95_15825 [Sorangium sp. So ce327]|uniref:hypothetical protein n=1 Tax=Sorangium sp. So ce327 TaxID=3133301 RepID=UPI003F60778C